jgi:tripartite-type tricarboxylate transporter receptor subunit TctC
MYGPRGLPGEVVSRLSGELDKLLRDPGMADKLVQLGVEPKFMTGAAFGEFSRNELAKWGRVIRESGATAD